MRTVQAVGAETTTTTTATSRRIAHLVATQLAGRRPRTTMAVVAIGSLAVLVAGLFSPGFHVQVDSNALWTPMRSKVDQHAAWTQHDTRLAPLARRFLLLFHHDHNTNTNDHNDPPQNILTQDALTRVFQVLDAIHAVPAYASVCGGSTIDDDGKDATPTLCPVFGVVDFFDESIDVFRQQVQSDDDVLEACSAPYYPDGRAVARHEIMGHWRQSDDHATARNTNTTVLSSTSTTNRNTTTTTTNRLISAESLIVRLYFPNTPAEAVLALEQQALDVVLALDEAWQDDATNNSTCRVQVQAERSFDDEFSRAIVRDIPLVPVVFVVMSLFAAAAVSPAVLGLAAVAAVVASLATGYGLLFLAGVPLTSMTQILPFVIFGIGLDDAFVLWGAWRRQQPQQQQAQEQPNCRGSPAIATTTITRVQATMEDAGLSITLTTLTSTLAFGLGCLSSVPAVYWLCLYASVTIVVVYLYQLTFFMAALVLLDNNHDDHDHHDHHQQQDDNNHDMHNDNYDIHNSKDNTHDAKDNQLTNGPPHDDVSNMEDDDKSDQHPINESLDNNNNSDDDTDDNNNNKEKESTQRRTGLDRIMAIYAHLLLQPPVKVAVLVAAGALAVACAFSTTHLVQHFDLKDLLPADSYLKDLIEANDEYAGRSSLTPAIYFRHVNQSDPDIQAQMQDYVDDLVNIPAISEPPPYFWLRDFRTFVAQLDALLLMEGQSSIEPMSFREQMEIFLSVPLYRELYRDHIVLDPVTGDVVESRCFVNMDGVDFASVDNLVGTLLDQRAVSEAQPINQGQSEWPFFTYDSYFNGWEFFARCTGELILTTILGVTAVSFVAFLLVPHWTGVLFVLPTICVLYIDLLGFLQWCGVAINPVSYVALVMSIGLLVDFLLHILLRYYESDAPLRHDKVVDTLTSMGSSVVLGGASTLLGTVPLAFTSGAIFTTIFTAFIGLVLVGGFHGLVVLPVLLSILGPQEEEAVSTSSSSSSSSSSPPSPSSSSASFEQPPKDLAKEMAVEEAAPRQSDVC